MPLLHYVENPNKIVLLLSKLKEELFNQKSLYIDKSSLLLTGIPIYEPPKFDWEILEKYAREGLL